MINLTIGHFANFRNYSLGNHSPIGRYKYFSDNKEPFTIWLTYFSQTILPDGFIVLERQEVAYSGDDSIFNGWAVIGMVSEIYPLCKQIT